MANPSNGIPEKTCSKCGTRPANKGHEWCSQCKLESQSQNEKTKEEMAAAKAFASGAEAMRSSLVERWRIGNPTGQVMLGEVVRLIACAPLPQRSDAAGDS